MASTTATARISRPAPVNPAVGPKTPHVSSVKFGSWEWIFQFIFGKGPNMELWKKPDRVLTAVQVQISNENTDPIKKAYEASLAYAALQPSASATMEALISRPAPSNAAFPEIEYNGSIIGKVMSEQPEERYWSRGALPPRRTGFDFIPYIRTPHWRDPNSKI